ncbi:MAG TPA: DUF5652 family protein [Patescibacteria group bacterium]|nr:DUF5652 family protein [Patescibacteria group bacterium]
MNNVSTALTAFISSHQYLIIVLSLIALVLKGFALWKSARNSQKYWFVALLIFNTLGVLELIYLKFFSKMSILPESSEKKKVLRKRPSKR